MIFGSRVQAVKAPHDRMASRHTGYQVLPKLQIRSMDAAFTLKHNTQA